MQSVIAGQLRHVLTFVGGGLAVLGYIDLGTWEILAGMILALFGHVWSAVEKWRAEK